MTFNEAVMQVDYHELVQNINIDSVLELTGLDGIVKPVDVRIITPEEYDEKYGDDEH